MHVALPAPGLLLRKLEDPCPFLLQQHHSISHLKVCHITLTLVLENLQWAIAFSIDAAAAFGRPAVQRRARKTSIIPGRETSANIGLFSPRMTSSLDLGQTEHAPCVRGFTVTPRDARASSISHAEQELHVSCYSSFVLYEAAFRSHATKMKAAWSNRCCENLYLQPDAMGNTCCWRCFSREHSVGTCSAASTTFNNNCRYHEPISG